MNSSSLVVLFIIAVVLIGGFALFSQSTANRSVVPVTTTSSEMADAVETNIPTTAEPMLVTLETQGNLGQRGTATITQNADGMAVVTLALTGGTFPDLQPAHIHVGACPAPGDVKYPLTNVVDGESVTILSVSLADLYASNEPLAVNVHKSVAESSVYTACGDLAVQSMTSDPRTDSSGTPIPGTLEN